MLIAINTYRSKGQKLLQSSHMLVACWPKLQKQLQNLLKSVTQRPLADTWITKATLVIIIVWCMNFRITMCAIMSSIRLQMWWLVEYLYVWMNDCIAKKHELSFYQHRTGMVLTCKRNTYLLEQYDARKIFGFWS